MSYTYQFPDRQAFLHTLRELLEAEKKSAEASFLVGASIDFETHGSYSGARWDAYRAELVVRAPVVAVARLTDLVKQQLLDAAARIMPSEAGYDLQELQVAPHMLAPPPDDQPLNTATPVSEGSIEHDGLRFRSRTETRIYDELKTRKVLFFPNATAVLGGKNIKREPDFLVCQEGRWGILEVMGDQYHTPKNAMQDHDRARLFKDYSILVIEFYDAVKFYNQTSSVVDDFLSRLQRA